MDFLKKLVSYDRVNLRGVNILGFTLLPTNKNLKQIAF